MNNNGFGGFGGFDFDSFVEENSHEWNLDFEESVESEESED